MKSKKLRDAFIYVSDENLDRADTYRKVRNPHWVRWTALAACLCLIVGITLWQRPGGTEPDDPGTAFVSAEPSTQVGYGLVASAAYPEKDGGSLDQQTLAALKPFLRESCVQLLSETDGENVIYSPLNIYMGLSMLAESTGGETQKQLMDVLGVDSTETLRDRAGALWRANHFTKENDTSLLANSIWLSEDLAYVEDGVKELARDYYASVFHGKMGSEEYDQALRDWLNEQTRGLLGEQTEGVGLDPNTVLALVSTVYFEAHWKNEFNPSCNDTKPFNMADGSTEDCTFMNRSFEERFYRGDCFDAVAVPLTNGERMWFLLPGEDSSPEALAEDERLMELLTSPDDWADSSDAMVHFSVPKFDITSKIDLVEKLKTTGVTDILDSDISNFSPILTGEQKVRLSEAEHAVRVKIYEEGVTAAAYIETEMAADEPEENPEEIDFVLDRPFLFAITSRHDLPLFLGVVNDPTDK